MTGPHDQPNLNDVMEPTENVTRDVQETADVVVVGSGAGGAVVAAELAARGRDVVLVEEGAFLTGKDFTGNPRTMIDLLYRNRGVTGALCRPPIPILRQP